MWFLYALLGAIGKSYSGFFRKKIAKSVSSAMYMWIAYSLILIVLTPFMFSRFTELKAVALELPIVLLGAVVTNLLATKLNMEALKREELSYTAPLNAMVPLFTLLIAAVFLNESPPRFGIIGVLAIVAGAYIVSSKPNQMHWYDPLKRLVTSAGAQLTIAVTLCYAFNTILIKVMTNDGYGSLTIFYLITIIGWLFLIHVPLLKRKEFKAVGRSDKLAILGGSISSFAGGYFHILATANTFTSYATSVRRLDALISILLGWRYLKETNIRIKLIGAGVMTVGTVLLAIS
jgi:drug/metabolite transporter (DMT)-like permease